MRRGPGDSVKQVGWRRVNKGYGAVVLLVLVNNGFCLATDAGGDKATLSSVSSLPSRVPRVSGRLSPKERRKTCPVKSENGKRLPFSVRSKAEKSAGMESTNNNTAQERSSRPSLWKKDEGELFMSTNVTSKSFPEMSDEKEGESPSFLRSLWSSFKSMRFLQLMLLVFTVTAVGAGADKMRKDTSFKQRNTPKTSNAAKPHRRTSDDTPARSKLQEAPQLKRIVEKHDIQHFHPVASAIDSTPPAHLHKQNDDVNFEGASIVIPSNNNSAPDAQPTLSENTPLLAEQATASTNLHKGDQIITTTHSVAHLTDGQKMLMQKAAGGDDSTAFDEVSTLLGEESTAFDEDSTITDDESTVLGEEATLAESPLTKSTFDGDTIDENGQLCQGAGQSPPGSNPRRCNTCHKKYRIGKRKKHYCCRCLSTFCHKHGKTTHSSLKSCKVSRFCVCQKCLQKEAEAEAEPGTKKDQ